MHLMRISGLLLTLAGLLAYVLGVVAPYGGAAFSVSAVMVGLTLVAVGGGGS